MEGAGIRSGRIEAITNIMAMALGVYLLGSLQVNFGWQYAILEVGVLSLLLLFYIMLQPLKKQLDSVVCKEADEMERECPKLAAVV